MLQELGIEKLHVLKEPSSGNAALGAEAEHWRSHMHCRCIRVKSSVRKTGKKVDVLM